MNRSIVTTAVTALACMSSISAFAQKQYPEQEKMKPGMSEYWTPQPRVVTPGDAQTNSAPSDAIILFDGKDLSAWESANGGPRHHPFRRERPFGMGKRERRTSRMGRARRSFHRQQEKG